MNDRLLEMVRIIEDEVIMYHGFCLDYDDVEAFADDLAEKYGDEVAVCYGATKLVLVDKYTDFVVKVPIKSVGGCQFTNAPTDDEDYVDDYCHTEAELYKRAKERGLSKYFAKTEYLTEYKGYPIYASDKVYPLDENYDICSDTVRNASEASNKSYSMFNNGNFRYEWAITFIEKFGTVEFTKLIDFVEEEGIGDLHAGNVGFTDNGDPVILDYSSYLEN